MKFKHKRKIVKTRRILIDFIKILIGTVIIAVGIKLFLIPNQLSTGGFSGIATIIYYIFNIPVGTTVLILNIPLFFIARVRIGKNFFINALIGTGLLSFFLNLLENIKPITNDRFLAFIYGSIIIGVGTAIVLKANASTGGTDLLASIAKSIKPHMKTGNFIVILDAIIVLGNALYFKDPEVGLYSALAIYSMGKVLDAFFEGIDFSKMLLIISPEWKKISKKLNIELRRGVTSLYGEGAYTQDEKKVLLCAMSRTEVRRARQIVEEIDPKAFIIITNAREVYGKGFKQA